MHYRIHSPLAHHHAYHIHYLQLLILSAASKSTGFIVLQGLQEDESRSSGGPGIQWVRAGGQRLERRGKVKGERWGKTWWSQPFLTETP